MGTLRGLPTMVLLLPNDPSKGFFQSANFPRASPFKLKLTCVYHLCCLTQLQIDHFIPGTFPKVRNFRKGMMKSGLTAGNF